MRGDVLVSSIGGLKSGLALGALTMFFFDPVQGRSRRARLRDRLVRLEHLSEQTAHTARQDVRNRARGLFAELRARARHERVDDDVLAERARSKAGRLISHPHALRIEARDGAIILTGHILTREVAPLLIRLRAVRGVVSIDNRLVLHDQSFGVPALQGGRATSAPPRGWSPALRLLATLFGGALAARGLRNRPLVGLTLGGAGAAVLVRGLTNLPVQRWLERALPRVEAHPLRSAPQKPHETDVHGSAPSSN